LPSATDSDEHLWVARVGVATAAMRSTVTKKRVRRERI